MAHRMYRRDVKLAGSIPFERSQILFQDMCLKQYKQDERSPITFHRFHALKPDRSAYHYEAQEQLQMLRHVYDEASYVHL